MSAGRPERAHACPWFGICFPFLHFIKTNTQQRTEVKVLDPSEAPLLTGPAYLSLGFLGGPLKDVVTGEVGVLGETQLAPELQL